MQAMPPPESTGGSGGSLVPARADAAATTCSSFRPAHWLERAGTAVMARARPVRCDPGQHCREVMANMRFAQ